MADLALLAISVLAAFFAHNLYVTIGIIAADGVFLATFARLRERARKKMYRRR